MCYHKPAHTHPHHDLSHGATHVTLLTLLYCVVYNVGDVSPPLLQTLPALCTDQAEMDFLMEALIMR